MMQLGDGPRFSASLSCDSKAVARHLVPDRALGLGQLAHHSLTLETIGGYKRGVMYLN